MWVGVGEGSRSLCLFLATYLSLCRLPLGESITEVVTPMFMLKLHDLCQEPSSPLLMVLLEVGPLEASVVAMDTPPLLEPSQPFVLVEHGGIYIWVTRLLHGMHWHLFLGLSSKKSDSITNLEAANPLARWLVSF